MAQFDITVHAQVETTCFPQSVTVVMHLSRLTVFCEDHQSFEQVDSLP